MNLPIEEERVDPSVLAEVSIIQLVDLVLAVYHIILVFLQFLREILPFLTL